MFQKERVGGINQFGREGPRKIPLILQGLTPLSIEMTVAILQNETKVYHYFVSPKLFNAANKKKENENCQIWKCLALNNLTLLGTEFANTYLYEFITNLYEYKRIEQYLTTQRNIFKIFTYI